MDSGTPEVCSEDYLVGSYGSKPTLNTGSGYSFRVRVTVTVRVRARVRVRVRVRVRSQRGLEQNKSRSRVNSIRCSGEAFFTMRGRIPLSL